MQLLKAIKCLFRGKAISTVKQTVNTVEGVEAVYESAIEEAEIKYEKSCSKLIEILGKIDTAEENLEKYKSDLAETEKRCKQLVDSNRIEDAKSIHLLNAKAFSILYLQKKRISTISICSR